MQIRTSLLLAASLALVCISSPAGAADPNQTFDSGTAAFAETDYLRALAYFKEARDSGLQTAAVDYNIAVCYYRLGDYSHAAVEFASIAERYPEMRGLAQYNLGLVALKESDQAAAEAYFRQALSNSDDETVRYLARRQLGMQDAAASTAQWFTLVDARFGYDDNVLLLDEEISLPDGRSTESSFTELLAYVTGPLKASGFRFDGTAFVVRYPSASVFDQTMLRVGGVYQWQWGAWQAEIGPHVSHTTLDGDTFEERTGAGMRLRRDIGAHTALGIRVMHDEVSEGDPRFASFDGSRSWLELRLDRRLPQGRVSLAYATEENDRRAASVSPERDKLSLRYRRSLNAVWLADLQLAFKESRYGELTVPRVEDLTELGVELTRSFDRDWQLNGGLSLADNDSAVATVEYRRARYSMGFAKQF